MPKRAIVPEDLLRFHYSSDPQISPNGEHVLFLHKVVGEKNKYVNRLWLVDRQGVCKPLFEDGANQSSGRWSPDGERILFIRSMEKEPSQLWLIDGNGTNAQPLTTLEEGSFGELVWSPDGQWVAFTYRQTATDFTETAKKQREETGASTPPRITEKPNYRLDGDGYYMEQRYKLYVVNVASKAVRLVDGDCELGSYSYDWSPDATKLAYKRSVVKNAWRDPEVDELFIWSLEGGQTKIESQAGYKSKVCWSPDGQWLAFLGNPNPHDHRQVANTQVFVVSASGGTPRSLTAETDFNFDTSTGSDTGDYSADFLVWAPNSTKLYVKLGAFGEVQLAQITLEGKVTALTEGQHVLAFGSLSSDGTTAAVIYSNPVQIGEVALLDLTSPAPEPLLITRLNSELFDELEVKMPEEHWVPSTDGKKVHTWVLRPDDSVANRAAILEVHGGPQMQYGWTFFHEFQVLAAAGYTVVYSNPRGGKGYGESHVAAISGRWGGKDWEDIAAVKDWMKSLPGVDNTRMGIMGGSYGGYMVNWAVGHTHDFKSAITDRCVSNLVSKFGNSDYPYFPDTYWKGAPYGSLEKIADLWRDSPMAYFDQVKTPMLIIHSEGDLRCNIEQSEQVFSSLQEQGILSRFVRYPMNTSHGMSRNGPPDMRIHRLKEILSWWERTL